MEFGASAEALSALEARPPDLLFLDLDLRDSDAIEAFRALVDRGYSGVVQLISGRGEAVLQDVQVIGARYGLRLLPPLSKPFRRKQIQDAVLAIGALARPEPEPKRPSLQAEVQPVFSLDEALDHGWLELWYQPQTDLRTGELIGAEGLIRARHPTGGIVGPATFLPGSSNESLARLTEFVLLASLRDWDRFHQTGRSLQLCVNIPVTALLSVPIATIVRQHRPQSQDWPGLIIEITEDQLLERIGLAQEIAAQLQIYGVRLSVDDFGEGYSSVSRLRSLPFKSLKIDQSFVSGCGTDPAKASICRSIIDMAHGFGCTVTAEGIENAADLAALTDMGCDYGQGYFLGRPMAVADLIMSRPGHLSGPAL